MLQETDRVAPRKENWPKHQENAEAFLCITARNLHPNHSTILLIPYINYAFLSPVSGWLLLVPPPPLPRRGSGSVLTVSLRGDRPILGGGLQKARGSGEWGPSISLPDDKLTLGKMYVTSHQSQLITSLAARGELAPSQFGDTDGAMEERQEFTGKNLHW